MQHPQERPANISQVELCYAMYPTNPHAKLWSGKILQLTSFGQANLCSATSALIPQQRQANVSQAEFCCATSAADTPMETGDC